MIAADLTNLFQTEEEAAAGDSDLFKKQKTTKNRIVKEGGGE
jgi:hypothetical protein